MAWAKQLLFTRAYRPQVLQLIDAFQMVLCHVQFGVVSDVERPERHLTRPADDCAAYRVMSLTFDQPLAELAGTDLILAYRLLDRPPVFVEYGEVCIEGERVVAREYWTHRADAAPLAGATHTVRIKTWIDGRATDFLVRSKQPFAVTWLCETDNLAGGAPCVTFRPGGIHRHAPSEV